jgi:hypothetical protein
MNGFKFGQRQLGKSAWVSRIGVVTLALGIGANVANVSVLIGLFGFNPNCQAIRGLRFRFRSSATSSLVIFAPRMGRFSTSFEYPWSFAVS